jgi:ADP-ribose pyrophosphatase
MKKWKKLSEEILHKNPWYEYRHDKYKLPNGKESDYYYVRVRGGGVVIPLLDSKRIILVKQYRYLMDRDSIEFPNGQRKIGQTCEQGAQTELEEEAGYQAGKLELVGQCAPYNGISDEITNVYLATELKKTKSHPDETEEIEILIKTPKEIDKMIETGKIWDGQMIAAWCLARKYLK